MNTYHIEVTVRGHKIGIETTVKADNVKQARIQGKEEFGMDATLLVTCIGRGYHAADKQFTYVSEDDGQVHTARTIDWAAILD